MVMLSCITDGCAYVVDKATDSQHLASLLRNFTDDKDSLELFLGLEASGVPVGAYMKEGERIRVANGGAYPPRPPGEWKDCLAAAREKFGPGAHYVTVARYALRRMWALPEEPEAIIGTCTTCGCAAPFSGCPRLPNTKPTT